MDLTVNLQGLEEASNTAPDSRVMSALASYEIGAITRGEMIETVTSLSPTPAELFTNAQLCFIATLPEPLHSLVANHYLRSK